MTPVLLDKHTVTFGEVIKLLEEIVAEQHEKTEVTCVYNVFDPEQTGQVSVTEIQEALHIWYGDRISKEEVQEISAFADLDNNGFVKEQGIIVLDLVFWKFQWYFQDTIVELLWQTVVPKRPSFIARFSLIQLKNSGLHFRQFSVVDGTAFCTISGKDDNLESKPYAHFRKISCMEFLFYLVSTLNFGNFRWVPS